MIIKSTYTTAERSLASWEFSISVEGNGTTNLKIYNSLYGYITTLSIEKRSIVSPTVLWDECDYLMQLLDYYQTYKDRI